MIIDQIRQRCLRDIANEFCADVAASKLDFHTADDLMRRTFAERGYRLEFQPACVLLWSYASSSYVGRAAR